MIVIVLVACAAHATPAPVANHAAAPKPESKAFEQVATALAKDLDGSVLGWGTAPLGGDGVPLDWAVIGYNLPESESGYLLETSAGSYWFVHFENLGEPLWGVGDGWTVSSSPIITFHSEWSDGIEDAELAMRGDQPVLLAHRVHDKATQEHPEGDTVDSIGPGGEALDGTTLMVVGPYGDADEIAAALHGNPIPAE